MAKRIIKEHEVRKQELLDIGQRLFAERGYETTTISAILEAAGVAKGTFYHYFKSKEDLLDALVARITEQIVLGIREVIRRPGLSAIEKLNLYFATSGRLKSAQVESLRSIMKPLMSDENLLLRHRMNRRTLDLVSPDLVDVVRQGVEEGTFDTPYPEEAVELMFGLGVSLQERNANLLLNMTGPREWDLLVRRTHCYQDALERLLGAPRGSLVITSEASLEAYRKAAGIAS